MALAGLLIAPSLLAQKADRWVDALYQGTWPGEIGQRRLPPTLSSEAEDDPTLSIDATDEEPKAAARRMAKRAEHLSASGRHRDAIEEFRRALAIDPRYYGAENSLALELKGAGELDLAIITLQHLTKSAPEHVLAFNNLAEILCEVHRYPEAEAVARQALHTHPYSFRANLLLGITLVRQGSWSTEARQRFEYAALQHPMAKTILAQWPMQ